MRGGSNAAKAAAGGLPRVNDAIYPAPILQGDSVLGDLLWQIRRRVNGIVHARQAARRGFRSVESAPHGRGESGLL